MFDIMFTIVPIFIGIVFVIVIATLLSPKLRGKLMSRQIKALKHMTDYSKEDLQNIQTNLAKTKINSEYEVLNEKEDLLTEINKKIAELESIHTAKKVRTIKEELSNTYCKQCGSKIDIDSKYCKICGREQ